MPDVDAKLPTPRPGDVFVFAVERISRYGACQVVSVDDESQRATVAVLAWTGPEVPPISEITGVPRMVKDFAFWSPQEIVRNVPLAVPASFAHIGSLPVTGEAESHSFGSWDFGREIAAQYRWDAKPQAATSAFRAALTSDETVIMPGLAYGDRGEPYEAKVATARGFGDGGGYRILDDFRLEALRSWPALYRLDLRAWRDDLVPFLESSPMVWELVLEGHGQRELDLSRTHLEQLSIDVTGLERLVLPAALRTMTLRGAGAARAVSSVDALLDDSGATVPGDEPTLQVVAERDGRWIAIRFIAIVPRVRGLERAHEVQVDAIDDLYLSDVVEYFPDVTWLHLFGSPGLLNELPALAALPKLETLWLCDLFGFPAEEFPNPDELPALVSLDLDSIPADVATGVRGAYKKTPRVALTVRKPRKPEWLAENIDNPLRHWDGQGDITAATAKKASASFISALRLVRQANPAAPEFMTSVTSAVEEFVGVIAALNRKRHFLDTLERDDVVGAVNVLTAGLSAQARRALEPFVEEALDD